jgi:hypothetical protein
LNVNGFVIVNLPYLGHYYNNNNNNDNNNNSIIDSSAYNARDTPANARRIPFVEKDFKNFHSSSSSIFLTVKTSTSKFSASGECLIIKYLT